GRVRQGLHAAMIEISAAIEDHLADIGCLGPLGDELADCGSALGRAAIGLALDVAIEARGCSKRAPRSVVDDLGIDVLAGAVNAQTGTTVSTGPDGFANARLAPFRSLETDGHLMALP